MATNPYRSAQQGMLQPRTTRVSWQAVGLRIREQERGAWGRQEDMTQEHSKLGNYGNTSHWYFRI